MSIIITVPRFNIAGSSLLPIGLISNSAFQKFHISDSVLVSFKNYVAFLKNNLKNDFIFMKQRIFWSLLALRF